MQCRIAGGEQQAAEAARIVEAQRLAGIEFDVDVIVRDARRRRGQHAQRARHAEMQDQRAGVGFEQQVLGASSGAANGAARDRSRRCAGSTGQRRRRSCTSRRLMRRPTTCGSMPRRVVSTSGSSGTCWRRRSVGLARLVHSFIERHATLDRLRASMQARTIVGGGGTLLQENQCVSARPSRTLTAATPVRRLCHLTGDGLWMSDDG